MQKPPSDSFLRRHHLKWKTGLYGVASWPRKLVCVNCGREYTELDLQSWSFGQPPKTCTGIMDQDFHLVNVVAPRA